MKKRRLVLYRHIILWLKYRVFSTSFSSSRKGGTMLELTSLYIFYLIFIVALLVIGVMANGFIVVINCLDRLRNKTMISSDVILTALSVFRLLFLGMTFCLHTSDDGENSDSESLSYSFLWAFFNACTSWMATCLVFFYCMKIVNFTEPSLLKMKMKISGNIPQLLLGSVLAALVSSLPMLLSKNCEHCCNETKIFLSNSSGACLFWIDSFPFSGLLHIAGTLPSFLSFLVSSVLLIHSLLQHSKRMRGHTDGFKDHMMDAHVKALKTVTSLLILYCAAFIAQVSSSLCYNPWTLLLCMMVIVTYQSCHAIILIFVNPKLKHALIWTLRFTKSCCLRQVTPLSHLKMLEKTDPS